MTIGILAVNDTNNKKGETANTNTNKGEHDNDDMEAIIRYCINNCNINYINELQDRIYEIKMNYIKNIYLKPPFLLRKKENPCCDGHVK